MNDLHAVLRRLDRLDKRVKHLIETDPQLAAIFIEFAEAQLDAAFRRVPHDASHDGGSLRHVHLARKCLELPADANTTGLELLIDTLRRR